MDKGLKAWLCVTVTLNLFGITVLTIFKFPFKPFLETLGIFNLVMFSALIFGLVFKKQIQKNPIKFIKKTNYIAIGAYILSFILLKTADIMEGKPLTITSFIWLFLYLIIFILLTRYVIKKLEKQEQEKQEQIH